MKSMIGAMGMTTMPPDGQGELKTSRILSVDDHPIVQEGLAQLVNRETDLRVVWQAQSCAGALEACSGDAPDLAIVDIALSDGSGIDLIKALLARHSRLPILVMSMHEESFYADRALRMGARGYVMKQVAPRQVILAIRAVLAGQLFIGGGPAQPHSGGTAGIPGVGRAPMTLARRALSSGLWGPGAAASRASVPVRARATEIRSLSNRELQVFQLVAQGLGKGAIAARLGLSANTVETHRKGIKRKLGVDTSAELARLAILHEHWGA